MESLRGDKVGEKIIDYSDRSLPTDLVAILGASYLALRDFKKARNTGIYIKRLNLPVRDLPLIGLPDPMDTIPRGEINALVEALETGDTDFRLTFVKAKAQKITDEEFFFDPH
jgi:hypothetical protein